MENIFSETIKVGNAVSCVALKGQEDALARAS